jgi:hypothetical protein
MSMTEVPCVYCDGQGHHRLIPPEAVVRPIYRFERQQDPETGEWRSRCVGVVEPGQESGQAPTSEVEILRRALKCAAAALNGVLLHLHSGNLDAAAKRAETVRDASNETLRALRDDDEF